jgi:N-acetylglucosamine-6-phosphate deacetylase
MVFRISAPRVLTGYQELSPGWLTIADGAIVEIGEGSPGSPVHLALATGFLAPGLVDAQVNGAFGVDLFGADRAGWLTVGRKLLGTGVTAFAPTFITAPLDDLAAALGTYPGHRAALAETTDAAMPLGVHCEGPFLADGRRGAHPAVHLCDPQPQRVAQLIEAGGGELLYVTLAPEREGALLAIRQLVAAGVLVAVGHSEASAEQVQAAADAGATLVTHLYNAQPVFHHRAPGIVGAALTDARLTCGLIVDGHHVAGPAVRVAMATAPGRIMLVSDAVAALGMPAGRYVLGEDEIIVRDDEPPLRADGTIAGGAGRLDDAIGLAVAFGASLQQAVEAATRIPADALGRPDLGRLVPGASADLVWFAADEVHPVRARTRAVWRKGQLAFGVVPW